MTATGNHTLRRIVTSMAMLTLILMATFAQAQYYPNMVYSSPVQVAPGVTYRTGTQSTPTAQRIFIFEIDLTNKNVELIPVFKAAGNVSGSANETTSNMARRTDAVAAVNAGYYNTTNFLTNSYTEIDGQFIGGAGTALTPENNRSILGFSGDHQTIAKRTKVSNAFVPADSTDWDKITDFIAGRGHFVTSGVVNGTVITQDNEGTTAAHNDTDNPRTLIGYTASPYKAYLVAVDGRNTGTADGMTYTELAQLMADLGIQHSVSLDGGGSTTAWHKNSGIVNTPSDGSERSVISSWIVATANTMDNTVTEAVATGSWTTDAAHTQRYHIDHLTTDHLAAPSSVTWTPDLGEAGLYRVYAWWAADAARATEAPYEIIHAGGTDIVTVNQRHNGAKWNVLGAYQFNAGTAGSVKLSNTATGSISADAIRFVKVVNVPGAIDDSTFTITSTLFETDFETDQSANFTLSHQNAADNSVNFNYDYSAYAQTGGIHPTIIPPSPNSPGAGTKALRLATNLTAATVNGLTATLNSIAGQTNMRITFDAWINYNGGWAGGTGSTEFMSFGGSANATHKALANSAYSGTNQPFSGFYFAVSSEGGATDDFRYYDGNGTGSANGSNAARANFLGTSATNNTSNGFYTTFYPQNLFETPGAPGKAWVRWEIVILNGQIRLTATKPDGIRVLLCNWFTPNANATMTGLLPHLGIFDPYAGSASPGSDNFVLYDNLKVELIAPATPAEVDSWKTY